MSALKEISLVFITILTSPIWAVVVWIFIFSALAYYSVKGARNGK